MKPSHRSPKRFYPPKAWRTRNRITHDQHWEAREKKKQNKLEAFYTSPLFGLIPKAK